MDPCVSASDPHAVTASAVPPWWRRRRAIPGVPKPILTGLQQREKAARRTLAALGYNECVTYSFIDQANAALFGGDVRNILIIKQDLALCNRQDAREHIEHRAFAAARRAQQANEPAILQRDAEVVHRRKVAEFLGKVLHHNAHSRTLRSIK